MPYFRIFTGWCILTKRVCYLSKQIPKQREPQWNRRESTFHLVCYDILLELWIATAENSEKINTKMNEGMLWSLDSCCPSFSSGSCCYLLMISSLFFIVLM